MVTVFCLWLARVGSPCAYLCVWGKVLFCYVLFYLNLDCLSLFSLVGAVHLVPCVASPSVAFCSRALLLASSTLNRRVSACKTREVPCVAFSVNEADKPGLELYYQFS